MIVRDNAGGRRAVRYFSSTHGKVSSTLEKLSSGYKINRAGDDAAGLAISEKMRLRVTGMTRARLNSVEGSRLIQTGEGALEEVHAMLDRASYLAAQSANGVYEDELDRENLQKELDHICSEIDRITKSANFNTIKLFQDDGAGYERAGVDQDAVKFQQEIERLRKLCQENAAASSKQTAAASSSQPVLASNSRLDALLEGQEKGDLNIVYVRDDVVETEQTPTGATSPTVTIGGTSVNLGDILQKQIVPNIVSNILTNYPAFSYLKGSSIGIGLRFYEENSSTLAYVEGSVASSGKGGYTTYTLGINLTKITTWDPDTRSDLEATIAHEMIHAFMDEATTSGMFGLPVNSTGSSTGQVTAEKFPDWFREGMAQSASGHNGWVSMSAANGLQLKTDSTDAEIQNQISTYKLGTGSAGSQYATGYLACMYLGSVIAGNGTPSATTDAATISQGLNKLMKEIINGSSLSDAIQKTTSGAFTSLTDFQTKFNGVTNAPGLCDFTRNLLTANGSGMGGLVSGNLQNTDHAADADLTGIKLFELNTTHDTVKNVYPTDYPVLSGGTVSKPGTDPTLYNPPFTDCGKLRIYGVTDPTNDISYDPTGKKLTIKAGADIRITMDGIGTDVIEELVIGENPTDTSSVTLVGVTLPTDSSGTRKALTVNGTAEITYEGKNTLGTVTQNGDITFKGTGTGGLVIDTLSGSGNVTFDGGAVVYGSGTDTIPANVTLQNKPLIVAGAFASAPSDYGLIDVPWSNGSSPNINGLGNLASIAVDGKKYDVPLNSQTSNGPKLWLDTSDPTKKHRVTFTDVNGTSKTLVATNNSGTLSWAAPARPFTVTGGTEGTDWEYTGDDGNTLLIKTNAAALEIKTDATTDENGAPLIGRIKIDDNAFSTSPLNLTLSGVTSEVTSGKALDLGTNNNVTLNLTDGSTNTFKSGSGYAGISIGAGTNLTINGGTAGNDGTLNVTGGADAAGIGSDGTGPKDPKNSITINGGKITATSVSSSTYTATGAAIGCGVGADFGTITITSGTVTANGGYGGAGIGGAGDDRSIYGTVGNIEITGGTITATSEGHGAGIGGGWGLGKQTTTSHDIHIGGTAHILEASSKTHGTGIGSGCLSTGGNIKIDGNAIIDKASGGGSGAGIGGSSSGACGTIEISGNATINETHGGTSGAGIGAGSYSISGAIKIDTTGTVNAYGGTNGVGIGSGYGNSTCGDIEILQGTITAKGTTDATGIGAGRNSTSGNVTIGDTGNKKIIVDATGGMTHNGGNIMSYKDNGHTIPGTVTITGQGTSVCPGDTGEGLYSTSGVTMTGSGGSKLYSYPLCITANPTNPLDASKLKDTTKLLPYIEDMDTTNPNIKNITAKDGNGNTLQTWADGITHAPLDNDYVYLWLTPENQTLTFDYTAADGTTKTATLDLTYFPDSGTFRVADKQPKPPAAQKPGYNNDPTPIGPTDPTKPAEPTETPEPRKPEGHGGIILQIGADYGETLEVPQFYLSTRALGLDMVNISTQDRALNSMPVLKNAINRVSSIRGEYGALQNRLDHNQNDLSVETENLTDAESRIRDADMAEEYTEYVKLTILQQSSQAMVAQCNQNASRALQILQ